MVLESVFSRITRDILRIDDMAAEETLQVQADIVMFSFRCFDAYTSVKTFNAYPLFLLFPFLA